MRKSCFQENKHAKYITADNGADNQSLVADQAQLRIYSQEAKVLNRGRIWDVNKASQVLSLIEVIVGRRRGGVVRVVGAALAIARFVRQP